MPDLSHPVRSGRRSGAPCHVPAVPGDARQSDTPDECARDQCTLAPARSAPDSPFLTEVELYWTRGTCEHWLRFGKPVATRISRQRRRVESYAPGQIFALVRWASDHHGSVLSQIEVLQAAGNDEPIEQVPDVTPGALTLLSARTWRQVRRVFALIEAVEALGVDPCDLGPAFWRDIHNRLAPTSPADVRANSGLGASLAQKVRRS